jgi:alpha-beta hydrolase superfamily lysophospholipase
MINVLTHTDAIPEITPAEHSMTLADGIELFYRAWIPREPTRKALVIFHRGHEHSGRLEDVVRDLHLRDVAVFAWDARGHGRSGGPRGYAPTFGRLTRDADEFIRHISQTHGMRIEDIVVLGHSVGAVAVTAWVHDYAPRVRAMVLVTPALRVKLYVPFARTALRIMRFLFPRRPMFVSSYVKGRLLTHDEEQARRYDEDPLISRTIAVNVLLGLHDTATRLIADAGAIRIPALVLAGGSDWVVDLAAEREFFDRLGSNVKRMRVFDGMYHDILHEKDRRAVLNDIRGFVRGAFARDEIPCDTDDEAYTRDEYERLRAPLPRFSPKRIWFAAQRAFLKTYGRLSNGIRLGWRVGFDSGSSLDYVYENRARGALLLGRIIDRFYLNNIAWAGIRQRKANIEKLLDEAIERVSETGAPVRILDVATGQGRYVLDTLAREDVSRGQGSGADQNATALLRDYSQANVEAGRALADPNVTAVLRDYSHANVEAGRALAARLGLKGVAFEQADAFDEASYSSLAPRPNIAIVSGLFELFPDNAPVRRCLGGIGDAIEEGGYLIYTGQPWHPRIEMIARVLTNRDGEPWVMRRRTQRELDELVRESGFEKIRTEVGGRGIFTVSIAKRRRDVR